jgi:sulfur carrier protein ThiS
LQIGTALTPATERYALKINLKLFGRFIQIFQMAEKEMDLASGATILDLIHSLCKTDEQRDCLFVTTDRNLRPNVTIRKNGRFIIHLNWLDTKLEEGDRVDILTLHCGG